MKKIGIFLVALCTAMVSCSHSYEAKSVALGDATDSINYALGFLNGAQIKMYYLANDSNKAVVDEFINSLSEGYENKQKPSEIEQIGMNLGIAIKQMEKKGIADNPRYPINEKMFFQGLVNGIYQDTVMMTPNHAREYYQKRLMSAYTDTLSRGNLKVVKAKCPSKVKQLQFETMMDSICYAFGLVNGDGLRQNVLTNDSTREKDIKSLVKAINEGLSLRQINPEMAQMGKNIGSTIRQQENDGLLGINGLETRFELIKQGFINGFNNDTTILTLPSADAYLRSAINELRYGAQRKEGEAFLAANKLREEVITTESGLQYEILVKGKGALPTKDDQVRVHYHGTLIDGTVFDSSVERGEPIVFGVTQVIPGWTEALQLMPVGSKWKLYIPYNLAYGENGAGAQIPPYSTLIFEVELLGIEK